MNRRIFVERKEGFTLERDELFQSFLHNYNVSLDSLRYVLVYDIYNIEESTFNKSLKEIFVEENKDVLLSSLPSSKNSISVEYLPGQYDQRGDSASICIKLIDPHSFVTVKSAFTILFDEEVSIEVLNKIKKQLINTVEAREKDLSKLKLEDAVIPSKVEVVTGFKDFSDEEMLRYKDSNSFACSYEDLLFIRDYFNKENRDPFITELKVLDTYWSDHCRHTTFETDIVDVKFGNDELSMEIEKSYNEYLEVRKVLNREDKPKTLMDIAVINARLERENGNLDDLEISEEVNACSIYIDVDVDGVEEKWLLMFKNETHNHPTEIEPFGGASTCIGGAIRDPLSGRSYVYSASRITGASDITEDFSETIDGKLPQRTISTVAAKGYSSYGNQIGLATTFVNEIYHDGYKAKRMEIGAVMGAVKASYVLRKTPEEGDVILLLGGRTGRDGIGGATGSSKEHDEKSLDTASSEVQKGNAIEERKIQRLFREEKVTSLIKKSNDFGAGGISVAIGELADSLVIDLDKVPTKYDGLDGTELAISESQERMAVVVEQENVELFKTYCDEENIEVSEVAYVTNNHRLVMTWKGDVICDLDREFIDSSGVRQNTKVEVSNNYKDVFKKEYSGSNIIKQTLSMLEDKNIASLKGLDEMFDSTIGRTTVLAPYGGKYQLTKTQGSIHKIPVLDGNTNTVSIMTYGYNPFISEYSPYLGSMYAVIESISKVVSLGADYKNIRFSFQEYFERLGNDALKWGKPFSSLLGAFKTLKEFNLAAIGGKDSMSGTYKDLNVPPTLVSFAVTTSKVSNIISNELKGFGNYLYLFDYNKNNQIPDFNDLKSMYNTVLSYMKQGVIKSSYALEYGGIIEALCKMSFGNKIGFNVTVGDDCFDYKYGSIIVESSVELDSGILLGKTVDSKVVTINNEEVLLETLIKSNSKLYNDVYPIKLENNEELTEIDSEDITIKYESFNEEEVRVLVPVFPGTNCEYDSYKAFREVGALVDTFVFRNLTEEAINESINEFVSKLEDSHILMLSGGFSSADEPDGSGKFISTVLKNELVKSAIEKHLSKKRLILGICNGFQALVKSGLLPYGEIREMSSTSPTLFKNRIGRHISKFVDTKVSSVSSPWLSSFNKGDIHKIAVSHGEGRFIVNKGYLDELIRNNQVAFTYVDFDGNITYDEEFNPNGSTYAIEGIVSKDGLILGKMGHSERYEDGLFLNIDGNKYQQLFKNGVAYFKGE